MQAFLHHARGRVAPESAPRRTRHACPAPRLRMLRPRPPARVRTGADLQLRVHLLRRLRRNHERPVPELRRRTRATAAPTRRPAREVPGLDRAHLAARSLRPRRRRLSGPAEPRMDVPPKREPTGPGTGNDARAARMRARSPLARIRRALDDGLDLPSLGELGPTIASAALSAQAEVERIAELALFDPAMLLRLLRAANSPAYITRSGDAVVSVTRAVMLLGYNEAREIALGLPLLDEQIADRDHRQLVRAEYAQANVAATLARRLLEARHAAVAEEGAIATLLGHSGRILAAIHAPQALVATLRAAE